MYNFMELIFKLNKLNRENIKFHGYRTARPKVRLVSFDRDDKEIERLEERLYQITGAFRDNHVLFEVKVNEYILALQFTDCEMCLGIGVEEKLW